LNGAPHSPISHKETLYPNAFHPNRCGDRRRRLVVERLKPDSKK
jgi:hypothetical protein